MSNTFAFIYLILSALASYVMCRSLITISHRHLLLDQVNERSSHKSPTPRIGGLSFVVVNSSLLICFIVFQHQENFIYWILLTAPLLVATISIVEDLTNKVSRKIRLLGHFLATAIMLTLINIYMGKTLSPLLCITLFIGITWFINLFNFMDGIDGIAATEALFIILATVVISFSQTNEAWSILLLCLSGPLLGFIIVNWQPARIFMGDIGSTYLGALIPAILLINIAEGIMNIWCAIILTGTFLMDATWTLLYRILSRQSWYLPHRSHTYQILSRKLHSHAQVNILNLCVNLFWLLPLGLIANLQPNYGQIFTIIALFPLALLGMLAKAGQVQSN
jgi:Fuc2NAc and GlcNAc transferase